MTQLGPFVGTEYVVLSAVIFLVGAIGVVLRRNPLVSLMAIELMWNAANLALVTYARVWLEAKGHVFVFLVVTVAAAEAAIGLAIIVVAFRRAPLVDVDAATRMHG